MKKICMFCHHSFIPRNYNYKQKFCNTTCSNNFTNSKRKGSTWNIKVLLALREAHMTLQKIADMYGVSRERIRQIIGNTGHIKKIKPPKIYKYPKLPKGLQRCHGKCHLILSVKLFYSNSRVCIECTKKNQKEYRLKHKDKWNQNMNKGGKYYFKNLARQAVHQAIRNGKIIKLPCKYNSDECSGQIQAHHIYGYDKAHYLDIEWICRFHHNKLYGSNWRKS